VRKIPGIESMEVVPDDESLLFDENLAAAGTVDILPLDLNYVCPPLLAFNAALALFAALLRFVCNALTSAWPTFGPIRLPTCMRRV